MNRHVSLSLTNRKSSVHLHALYLPRTALWMFTLRGDQLVTFGQYKYSSAPGTDKGHPLPTPPTSPISPTAAVYGKLRALPIVHKGRCSVEQTLIRVVLFEGRGKGRHQSSYATLGIGCPWRWQLNALMMQASVFVFPWTTGDPQRFARLSAAVCRQFRKIEHCNIVSYTERLKNTHIYIYIYMSVLKLPLSVDLQHKVCELLFNHFRKYFTLMYRNNVVAVTLTTGIMFLLFTCTHLRVWGILRRRSRVRRQPTKWSAIAECFRNISVGSTHVLNVDLFQRDCTVLCSRRL
jgi:hypothetical protein